MSTYRNILVALDGSADSKVALAHAVDLARDQNARLALVTVVPNRPNSVGAGVSPPPATDETNCAIIREALAELPRDLSVTTRIEHGDVASVLLKLIELEDYDLLVMGSHGHSRVHRALLGSVSERVLHTAAVPVLLLRFRCAASG